jgi:hypothetical protein
MSSLDQSAQQEALRRRYGGSEPSTPSFLRPQYVRFNALSKSRDFGAVDNLAAQLSGVVGGRCGSPTLFFKLTTLGTARLGLRGAGVDRYAARYLRFSLGDANHDPLPLDTEGFAYQSAIHNVGDGLANDRLPAGTYYVTISSDQWQDTPFIAELVVQRYLELQGSSLLQALPRLRLALVKLRGAASGQAPLRATALLPSLARNLIGAAGGTALPRASLAILRGAAGGTMTPYGRLKQTFRLNGLAVGTASSIATMTSSRPYGSGY